MAKKQIETIDDYIKTFPEEIQERLQKLRIAIRAAAPEANEKISYQIPTFTLHGNLVHFAGFKNHIGFYPAPSAVLAFKKDLVKFKQAKGSVQFPHSEPLPLALVTKIVKFRVQENSRKRK